MKRKNDMSIWLSQFLLGLLSNESVSEGQGVHGSLPRAECESFASDSVLRKAEAFNNGEKKDILKIVCPYVWWPHFEFRKQYQYHKDRKLYFLDYIDTMRTVSDLLVEDSQSACSETERALKDQGRWEYLKPPTNTKCKRCDYYIA